jgi:hypothetical protein
MQLAADIGNATEHSHQFVNKISLGLANEPG